jgi:hypothetical protein
MPASEAAGLADPAFFVPPIRSRSTRRFGLAWLLTPLVLGLLWPVLTLGWVNHYDDGEPAWIDGMYRRKEVAADRAAARADESHRPRLVVIGGSGSLLGVDAELLEMKLGVPVVNFGLHAGLATEYLLYRSRREIRPGDSVLLCPEYELWGYPAETFTDIEWGYVTSYDRRFLLDMDRGRALRVLYSLPLSEHVSSLRGWWKRVRGTHYQTRPGYNLGFIGPNGDLRSSRAKTPFPPIVNYPFPDVRTAESVRYFRAFAEWARANNVRVFMTWPNACRPELPLPPGGDEPPAEMAALLKEFGFIVLDRPPETAYPRQWFTDTSYHCDAQTRRLRTDALARRLRPHFGLSALPDKPSGFYLVASPAHRPRVGNAFADDPGVEARYLAADPVDHPDAVTPAQVGKLLDAGVPVYYDEAEARALLRGLGRTPVEVARTTASLPLWWRKYDRHVFLIARGGTTPAAQAGAAAAAPPAAPAAGFLPADLARALAGPAPVVAAVGTGPYVDVKRIVTATRGGGRGPALHTDFRSIVRRDVPQFSIIVSAQTATAAAAGERCMVRINREVRPAPAPDAGATGADGSGGVSVAVVDPVMGVVVDAATFPDAAGGETVTWRMNRIDPPR